MLAEKKNRRCGGLWTHPQPQRYRGRSHQPFQAVSGNSIPINFSIVPFPPIINQLKQQTCCHLS